MRGVDIKAGQRAEIAADVARFVGAGGRIEPHPIYYRDDDILAGGRTHRPAAAGRPAPSKEDIAQARLLNAAGWSRDNIGRRLGVSRTTVSRWLQA